MMNTLCPDGKSIASTEPGTGFGAVHLDEQLHIISVNSPAATMLQINASDVLHFPLAETLPWLKNQLLPIDYEPRHVITPGGQELLTQFIPLSVPAEIPHLILILYDYTSVEADCTHFGTSYPPLHNPSANQDQPSLASSRSAQTTDAPFLVYRSSAMGRIVSLAAKVAHYDTIVLLRGESGVGKDILARYIHEQSPRGKRGPFIKINCGALPENLLESELFGYEPGAFTGANKEGKKGLFEQADKGTIFLDEIGELPLPMQVKLLNVIQDKTFYRIGGQRPVSADFRIIAATNAELEQLMSEGRFRRDLFYRLNVFPIVIPPLRERPVDIPRLLYHFLQQENVKYDTVKFFSPQTFEALQAYHWPGNVRELRNIVERLFVSSDGECLDIGQLPEPLQTNLTHTNTTAQAPLPAAKTSLKSLMSQYEREVLKKCLANHRTLKECADFLEIDLTTLVRKRKKYSL